MAEPCGSTKARIRIANTPGPTPTARCTLDEHGDDVEHEWEPFPDETPAESFGWWLVDALGSPHRAAEALAEMERLGLFADDGARGPEAHPERDPDVLQLEIDACRAEIVRLRGQVAAHESQQEAWLDAEGALRGEIDLLREIVRSFDDCSLSPYGSMDDHEWNVLDGDLVGRPVTEVRPDLAECLRRCGVTP